MGHDLAAARDGAGTASQGYDRDRGRDLGVHDGRAGSLTEAAPVESMMHITDKHLKLAAGGDLAAVEALLDEEPRRLDATSGGHNRTLL